MVRTFSFVFLLAACVALEGCGGGGRPEAKKHPVNGEVTLDGKPMADGIVYFKTVATGAIDFADVKDGKFQGRAEAGQRRVEIFAFREGKPIQMGDQKTGATRENYLPAKYNTESTLTENVQQGPSNRFEFKLESK